MKIAVLGAGAIGNLVAGYLKLKGEEVSLLGRPDSVWAISQSGLKIRGVRGSFDIKVEISDKLAQQPDLAILTVKTQDIAGVINSNLEFLESTAILTSQNGIRADNIVARLLPKANVTSSIVMFGATYLNPGEVVHNFEGSWIIGKMSGSNDRLSQDIRDGLNKIFPAVLTHEIKGMKYLKIFVNANNCIPAILGVSMQDAFLNLDISHIAVAIWKEGMKIINQAGIKLVSLPDFSLERLVKLTSLPALEGAKIFSGIVCNLSKEPVYGSILQSIRRQKPSEIDYINGEFVALAKENNIAVPLNEKLVELVHNVEKTRNFYSKDQLLAEVGGLIK